MPVDTRDKWGNKKVIFAKMNKYSRLLKMNVPVYEHDPSTFAILEPCEINEFNLVQIVMRWIL